LSCQNGAGNLCPRVEQAQPSSLDHLSTLNIQGLYPTIQSQAWQKYGQPRQNYGRPPLWVLFPDRKKCRLGTNYDLNRQDWWPQMI
jgi:hypothetical protein